MARGRIGAVLMLLAAVQLVALALAATAHAGQSPAQRVVGQQDTAAQQDTAGQDATTEALEQEKLRAEIRKIEQEIAQSGGLLGQVLRVGPLATAIAALVTAGIAYERHVSDQRARAHEQQRLQQEQRQQEERQHEADRRQREADRRQREADSLRRFDETFAQTLARLGSESVAERVSGAASLLAVLKPRYQELVDDVLAVIVANLKLDQPDVVADLLRTAFERAMRLYTCDREQTPPAPTLDLARTKLTRVDLEGIDLNGIVLDVAFADLSRANLTGLQLAGLRGYDVDLREARLSRSNLQEARLNAAKADRAQFHAARLVSATFKPGKDGPASLRGAQFQQAQMQSGHFTGADLTGARFEQANVADTYFLDATFDETALRSLLRTANGSWRDAHFDEDVRARLEALDDEEAPT